MAGQTITLHQDVTSTQNIAVVVHFEIDDSTGQPISQVTLDSQQLAADNPTPFGATLNLPSTQAAGIYAAKAGVFSSDGKTQLASNDAVGTFVLDTSNMPQQATDASSPSPSMVDSSSPADDGDGSSQPSTE
jgi:hypothetical protein